jgi:hypothetical protein
LYGFGTTTERNGLVTFRLSGAKRILVLAHQGGDLVAYDPTGTKAWVRDGLAVDGIRLQSCIEGVITADIEYDYDGSWRTVRLSAADGLDL